MLNILQSKSTQQDIFLKLSHHKCKDLNVLMLVVVIAVVQEREVQTLIHYDAVRGLHETENKLYTNRFINLEMQCTNNLPTYHSHMPALLSICTSQRTKPATAT